VLIPVNSNNPDPMSYLLDLSSNMPQ